jgi:phospholipase C
MLTDRRTFLRFLTSAAAAASFPKSIDRALAIPANHRTGTIRDVEHIVILMQENRAFDHYFGSLHGVRGFGDPRPMTIPSGQPVWYQPEGAGVVLPFHPTAPDFGLQFLVDTAHGWFDQHAAWNNGRYDQWIAAKQTSAVMAFYQHHDIPFFYALADAFTICDAYYCSLMGPTDPNRYHMWTGWVGNDGKAGGPVINNAEAGYDWSTYPERLERAGISWKIYQDIGLGLDEAGVWGFTDDPYIGNYGDNALLYFHQYQNAKPGEPLYEKARTGTNIHVTGQLSDLFGPLRDDVRNNRLPQVSWIVASDSWAAIQGKYDLSVFGPNGFLRTFRGSVPGKTNLHLETRYEDDAVVLTITNVGKVNIRITVDNAYGKDRPLTRLLRPGHSDRQRWHLVKSFGWYDLSVVADTDPGFLRRLAGHLENGRDSVSDPAFGVGGA